MTGHKKVTLIHKTKLGAWLEAHDLYTRVARIERDARIQRGRLIAYLTGESGLMAEEKMRLMEILKIDDEFEIF
jgi:hypothetical protein